MMRTLSAGHGVGGGWLARAPVERERQPGLERLLTWDLQTCVRTLYLPNYETEQELAEGLEEAFANAGALLLARRLLQL